jgi:hypothetical protein
MLKRTIKACLDLIDPLTRDGTNAGRRGNQISRASALKGRNLLCHRKLPFRMSNMPIRSALKHHEKTIAVRGIAIKWSEAEYEDHNSANTRKTTHQR